MKIAITGASGLIGTALQAHLRGLDHDVLRLVRRSAQAPDEVFWSPADGEIDAEALEGVDAVVHLAGENIAARRWTPAFKQKLLDSRKQGTGLIARTLAGLDHKPGVLISASAIGYYGDRGDQMLDESAAPGDDFMAEICLAWEAAADPARAAGIRVVHPRIGLVLSAEGGLLAKILPIFKLGLGGKLGRGDQWMSWVGLDDVVQALAFMLETPTCAGPMNLAAPNPVTNREFTNTLGKVLGRPTILPVPKFGLSLAMGSDMADVALSSARVVPKALQEAGFVFGQGELTGCLRGLIL